MRPDASKGIVVWSPGTSIPTGADLGQHGLRPRAVAGVPTADVGRVMLLVAEAVPLALERGLHLLLRQLLKQPLGATELQYARAGPRSTS